MPFYNNQEGALQPRIQDNATNGLFVCHLISEFYFSHGAGFGRYMLQLIIF